MQVAQLPKKILNRSARHTFRKVYYMCQKGKQVESSLHFSYSQLRTIIQFNIITKQYLHCQLTNRSQFLSILFMLDDVQRNLLYRYYILYTCNIFPMAQHPLVDQDLLIIEVSRSHSDKPHWVGLFWKSDQPDAETSNNTPHSQQPDIHNPCGIRTRNPSKRAAADSRLRPRGHWNRQYTCVYIYIYIYIYIHIHTYISKCR